MNTTTDVLVRCNRCHWEGKFSQLIYIHSLIYSRKSKKSGDIIPRGGCPACLTHDMLEWKEDKDDN